MQMNIKTQIGLHQKYSKSITQFRVCNQMPYVSAVRIPVNLRLSEQEPLQLSVWTISYRLVSTFSVSVEETELILQILLFLLLPAWSETRKDQNQLESSWFTCENQ